MAGPLRNTAAAVAALAMLALAACSSGSDEAALATAAPSETNAAVVSDAATTTAAPTTTTTTDTTTTTTTIAATVTDAERVLVAQCVTAVWGVTGFDQAGFDTAAETCESNAQALDSQLGDDTGEPLRLLFDTTVAWIDDEITDSEYPTTLYLQVVELQDEYYPANDAIITDDAKRAIAGCMDALSVPAVVRADIVALGDRSALDAAIAACGTAGDAASIDAALDAPGISIAKLVSLDMASINLTLTTAGINTSEITVDNFDGELLHRVDRYNFLLPTL